MIVNVRNPITLWSIVAVQLPLAQWVNQRSPDRTLHWSQFIYCEDLWSRELMEIQFTDRIKTGVLAIARDSSRWPVRFPAVIPHCAINMSSHQLKKSIATRVILAWPVSKDAVSWTLAVCRFSVQQAGIPPNHARWVRQSDELIQLSSSQMIVGQAGKDLVTGASYPAFIIRTFVDRCVDQPLGKVNYAGAIFDGRLECCSSSLCNAKRKCWSTIHGNQVE